jgi:hypothetical protein
MTEDELHELARSAYRKRNKVLSSARKKIEKAGQEYDKEWNRLYDFAEAEGLDISGWYNPDIKE